MHLHFERSVNTKCDCSILSLTWMGKVPDELPEDEGWKLNRTNYYQEGWLATGNVRGIVGVTFTTSHCKKNVDFPLRTNYNLRGHRSEVILVKWNEPYQKLASCDSSGIIFVWIKYEGRWSIELINDRNTPVTHFSWSHDGRMALICYQDGFVLVGSVAGQRYWSSMLNLESTITCGIWTPDDQQVYFGTASGQLVVMDVHGAMVSQVALGGTGSNGTPPAAVHAMAWSCEKFKMEEGDDNDGNGVSTQPTSTSQQQSTSNSGSSAERKFVLAVCFQNGYIYLLKTFDDVSPIQVDTGLQGPLCMEWSNSRELLAVAGTIPPDAKAFPVVPPVFKNVLKFYTDTGVLLYSVEIPCTQSPVSALTWGHNDKRLFMATGNQVHIAWVSRRVASLQLMCRLKIQSCLRSETQLSQLPLPPRIRNLIGNLFAQTIRCCVPEASALREFVSRPPVGSIRLHCTMIRHDDDSNLSSGTCYTLYLEYLGGLVPLLKGKRTSKIRPEFVIFDPQVEELCLDLQWSPESGKSSGSSQSTSGSGSGIIPSDTSDSDHEDGCASPRMQRRRKRRNKSRSRSGQGERQSTNSENTDMEDLAYIDTLPEHVRLVEVTSNIWGTKFKIHGLASSVPANLGQVTYKTSLLHLQPRQMTLVMTELRDDIPPGPDPNFNPNLFSEDEEENSSNGDRSHVHKGPHSDIAPPIAPMSPRGNRFARPKSQISNHFINADTNNSNLIPALARAESYEDEFPYVDLSEMVNFCESLRSNSGSMQSSTVNSIHGQYNRPSMTSAATPVQPSTFSSLVNQYSRSSSSSGAGSQNRHAVSPLCCDGSVPALQSPKNAVAPSDIIFDRPPAQTLISYSTADYSNNVNSVQQVKSALMSDTHVTYNKNGVTLHLNLDQNKSVLKKRLDNANEHNRNLSTNATDVLDNSSVNVQSNNMLNKSRNVSEISPNSSSIINTGKRKPFNNKSSPSGNQISIGATKWTGKSEELKYIDEDSITEIGEASSSTMRRAVTVGPQCLPDSMVRSCSVGYLDLVDAQLVPCDLALAMLRKDTPKRLVLVNRKTKQKKQNRKHHATSVEKDIESNTQQRSPKLATCGKSKSLDSSDLPVLESHNACHLPDHQEESISSSTVRETDSKECERIEHVKEEPLPPVTCTEAPKLSFFTTSKTPSMKRKVEESSPKLDHSDVSSSEPESLIHTCNNNNNTTCVKSAEAGTSRNTISLHTQALTTLENLLNRIRELDDKATPPASPVMNTRLPRSSPSSPAPSKKGKRNQSASPIRRHLLNSPLLGRRSRKNKNIESSDDEVNVSGDEVYNGKNYRDLETFQKAQLRQKLKRGKIEPNGVNCSTQTAPLRREFVMHNKAPMWNENSQVYQLDFGGRVTQESAKNFQIEFRGKQVMQFGRIDGNAYTLDFQYPFSALQAFAVALANVTQRLK